MSRPIEYRVWSEDQRTYDYKFPYNSIGDFYVSTRGKVFSDFGNTVAPEVRQEAFIVEQYTGLKDKNGEKIYEGDIVNKRYVNFSILDSVGVVEMGELYDSDGWTNRSILGWRVCARYEDSSLLDVCSECEVIGNIHENPELLEGEK